MAIAAPTAPSGRGRRSRSVLQVLPTGVVLQPKAADEDAKSAAPPPETKRSSSPERSVERPQTTRRRPVFVGGDVLVDYAVLPKVLGSGHYGVVRECVRRSTKEAYACKSIDKAQVKRLDYLKREVELMSEVDHPCIVKMVDCYEDEQYVHIVTERYTGGELFDRIIENAHDKGCFSEERAAGIVKSLLESVAYLHERDIVHRDIKPENILFETEEERNVRLIDFGLSRRHGKGEAPMCNPVGTAYYMAPEVLNYGDYDRSCDLWSVGAIAYILLCGFPPFNGDTDPEIFEAIERGTFDFPRQWWGNKSDGAKDLIKCLLRKDPRKRLTAEEALRHPWIENRGRKPAGTSRRRRDVQSLQSALRSMLVF